jgi:transcription antitermination factor NusG
LTYEIITVGPNCEVPVSRMLDRFGLEHIWFRVRRRVIHRGKLAHRVQPLFPGYIFIIAKWMYRIVESISCVRGFVRFGGVIEEVPIKVVNDLRLRAGAAGILNEDSLPFNDGQPVIVRMGGNDTMGVFRSYLTPARAAVEVRMMGRACSVTVRLGDLRAAG